MEETLDLIRLLAAAPAEEPPLSRPADLMAQMKEEKIVREGVQPAGPAVPDAQPNPSPGVLGPNVHWREAPHQPGTQSNLKVPERIEGQYADPRIAAPNVPVEVSIKTQEPVYVEPVRVMSPETVFGRSATPYVLAAIEGLPSEVKARGPVTAVANPNPQSQVTITVPPAFPIDPTEAFAQADSEIELPPRPGRLPQRDLGPLLPDPSESTEAEVAAAYQSESYAVDRERWDL